MSAERNWRVPLMPVKEWTIERDKFVPPRQFPGDAQAARMLIRFRSEAHPSQHHDASALSNWAYSQHSYLKPDAVQRVILRDQTAIDRTVADFDREYAAAHAKALEERDAARRDYPEIESVHKMPAHTRSPEQVALLGRAHALGYLTEAQVRRETRMRAVFASVLQLLAALLGLSGLVLGFIAGFWFLATAWAISWGLFAWANSVSEWKADHYQAGVTRLRE